MRSFEVWSKKNSRFLIGIVLPPNSKSKAPAVANMSDPIGTIERQVRDASGGTDPAAMRDAAVSAVTAALTADDAEADTAREDAAAASA